VVSIPVEHWVYQVRGRELYPRFLGPADHPWLAGLLSELDRSIGWRWGEAKARLSRCPADGAAEGTRRMAIAVLSSLVKLSRASSVPPRRARAELFGLAPRFGGDRPRCVEAAAANLKVTPAEVEESLFADLPDERRVEGLSGPLTPAELAVRSNLVLAQSLLFRASEVKLSLEGAARPVIRQAQLGGLICSVSGGLGAERAQLSLTGPMAILHRTLLYGRALGRLLPFLAWSRRFELDAEVVVGEGSLRFRLRSPAPIFPAGEPKRFDSKLEEQLARRFARIAPDWELIREPAPVRAGSRWIFPDFIARRREQPERQVWIELAGFWTPRYLEQKLEGLRAANLELLLLCVDEDLCCEEGAIPSGAAILRFRRKLDPALVLAAVERIA
jgi:hypothetical protein